MHQKIKDGILASFIADALSLGVHWVYDINDIQKEFGRLEKIAAPGLAPYHGMKQKGDFTHYGDQTMRLMESIHQRSGFDPEGFKQDWLDLFKDYKGYVDQATKTTIKNHDANKGGSGSTDLGGAARIAPLSLLILNNESDFIQAARAQTAMTHNTPVVLDTAEFFAHAFMGVLEGKTPTQAIDRSLEIMSDSFELHHLVTSGRQSITQDTPGAIAQMGQACSTIGALQSTIHLILKYEDDLNEALVENINAGGDSSARGMLTGFILGAYNGLESIPESWKEDLNAWSDIISIIEQSRDQ
ncbi:MAG: ADP-ribosylglycohydrolase family protein [Desulfobacteraceae bacterium]|nr:MAG: ADP-ribosylglycohydrolase family protein [Desulfobacteraceae bacterium]